jgi:hypothetical protein
MFLLSPYSLIATCNNVQNTEFGSPLFKEWHIEARIWMFPCDHW